MYLTHFPNEVHRGQPRSTHPASTHFHKCLLTSLCAGKPVSLKRDLNANLPWTVSCYRCSLCNVGTTSSRFWENTFLGTWAANTVFKFGTNSTGSLECTAEATGRAAGRNKCNWAWRSKLGGAELLGNYTLQNVLPASSQKLTAIAGHSGICSSINLK